MKKRIVIIDNEPLIPDFIKEIIDKEEGFEVSQVAGTKESFVKAAQQGSFDIALVDISINEREDGFELLQILQRTQLPAIVLSAHSEMDYGFKCLLAGAKGYVNKSEIYSSLVVALKEVCAGNLFVSGDRGADILNQYKKYQFPS